jgi:hypothetical protein
MVGKKSIPMKYISISREKKEIKCGILTLYPNITEWDLML